MMTTWRPSTGTAWAASSSTIPAGVHGSGRRPEHQPPEVHGVQAVDVLVGVDGEQRALLVEAVRQRDLDQERVDGGVLVERRTAASTSSGGGRTARWTWCDSMPISAQSSCLSAT